MRPLHVDPRSLLAALALIAVASGCGEVRPLDGREAGCGSCHAFPPAADHPQPSGAAWAAADCNGCHADTVDAAGATLPASAGGAHGNGRFDTRISGPDTGQALCGYCHAVPPGGAHPQPVAGLFAAFAATDCVLCHASAIDGAGAPIGAPLGAHLDGRASGNGAAGQVDDCESCHGGPPPPQYHLRTRLSGTAEAELACTACHVGFVPATHPVAATLTCSTCHGDASADPVPTTASPRAAAPGTDTHGRDGAAAVGAHAAHLDEATFRATPLGCTACHPGADGYGELHADGIRDLAFTVGGVTQGNWDAGVGGAAGTCSSTWCHGAFPGGAAATVSWDGPAIPGDYPSACSACHGYTWTMLDVGSRHTHWAHVNGSGIGCQYCHRDATAELTGTPGLFTFTSLSLVPEYAADHVDGAKSVQLMLGEWHPDTATCTGSCHGATSEPWLRTQ